MEKPHRKREQNNNVIVSVEFSLKCLSFEICSPVHAPISFFLPIFESQGTCGVLLLLFSELDYLLSL